MAISYWKEAKALRRENRRLRLKVELLEKLLVDKDINVKKGRYE